MLWLLIVVQWLHVLGGIVWFGSSMLTDFVLLPMLRTLSSATRTEWLRAFASRYGRLIGPIGGLTILLGVLRGILAGVFGQLGSAYGLTWIAAIVVGFALAAIGGGLIGRSAARMATASDDVTMNPLYNRVQSYARFEAAGFLIIFSLMIAMRFGY